MHNIEFWLAINEAGEFRISTDTADDALQQMTGEETSEAIRVVHFNLNVQLPQPTEVEAQITEGANNVEIVIK